MYGLNTFERIMVMATSIYVALSLTDNLFSYVLVYFAVYVMLWFMLVMIKNDWPFG